MKEVRAIRLSTLAVMITIWGVVFTALGLCGFSDLKIAMYQLSVLVALLVAVCIYPEKVKVDD